MMHMDYTEMLNKLIDESGKMSKEICEECNELYGIKLTTAYLSSLKTTKGRNASPEVSRAIAKACNSKYEDVLVVQAFLDKAPDTILEFFQGARELMDLGKSIGMGLMSETTEIETEYKKSTEISLAEFICESVEDLRSDSANMKNELSDLEPKCMVITPEQMKNIKFIKESDYKKLIEGKE